MEIHSPSEVRKYKIFNKLIKRRWGTSITLPKSGSEDQPEFEKYENDDEPECVVPDIKDAVDIHGQLLWINNRCMI